MFGFRRRECPRVQLYGKLPIAKDYLRLGLGEGAGLRFREWLDRTFSTGSDQEPPQLAWPARFLVGDPAAGVLQGVAWPSSDAGGLRPFPFVLCVERRRRAVLDDLGRGLPALQGVWRELVELQRAAAAQADGRAAVAALRGATVDVEAVGAAQQPGSVELDAWLDALWPDRGRDGLHDDLARLRTAGAPAEATPLRLPLAPGACCRPQVEAWLDTLRRLGALEAAACPTLFFPLQTPPSTAESEAAVAPFLSVFRTALVASHGAWLQDGRRTGPLAEVDLVGGRPLPRARAGSGVESAPPLAASVGSIVTRFLARTRSS